MATHDFQNSPHEFSRVTVMLSVRARARGKQAAVSSIWAAVISAYRHLHAIKVMPVKFLFMVRPPACFPLLSAVSPLVSPVMRKWRVFSPTFLAAAEGISGEACLA